MVESLGACNKIDRYKMDRYTFWLCHIKLNLYEYILHRFFIL